MRVRVQIKHIEQVADPGKHYGRQQEDGLQTEEATLTISILNTSHAPERTTIQP